MRVISQLFITVCLLSVFTSLAVAYETSGMLGGEEGVILGAAATFEVSPLPLTVKQGNTLVLYVKAPPEVSRITMLIFGKDIPLYPSDKGFRGVLGLEATTRPGSYTLLFKAETPLGTERFSRQLLVKNNNFLRQWGRMESGTLSLLKWIAEDQEKFTRVLTREGETQYWSGNFIMPAKGSFTSPFGTRRVFNGEDLDSHRGTDIAGPVGSQIRAANAGVVTLAEKLKVHGGTVVIDHGQGIGTLYCHLSKILVKAGDRVFKGQLIARMGNTGFSSGPHLHYGLSVHDMRVDPLEFSRLEIN